MTPMVETSEDGTDAMGVGVYRWDEETGIKEELSKEIKLERDMKVEEL